MEEVRPSKGPRLARVLVVPSRLLLAIFVLLTSWYCVLAYIPFTSQWVIKCTLVKWLPVFVRFHPALYWLVIAVTSLSLLGSYNDIRSKRLAIGFIVFHSTAGILLVWHPLLPSLSGDIRSFHWSLISLFPLFWLSAIDLVSKHRPIAADRGSTGYSSAALAAIFISFLYIAIFGLSRTEPVEQDWRRSELIVSLSWSLATHLSVFTICFVALGVMRLLATRSSRAAKIEFWNKIIFLGLLLASLIRTVILSSISFTGMQADVFSIVTAASIMTVVSGLHTWWRSERPPKAADLSRSTRTRWFICFVGLAVIAAAAYLVPATFATRDWDFLIQKLGVLTIWAATFGFLMATGKKAIARTHALPNLLLLGVVVVGWYTILQLSAPLWPSLLGDERLDVHDTLERYADHDVSFRLARNILQPRFSFLSSSSANVVGNGTIPHDDSFYGFLQENTNLMPSVKVSPVDVKLAGELGRTNGPRPNIFVFVIDSLRQDYVSLYNHNVSFTPNFAAFARDSIVMRNAFTRYGGTVLAEPSIWSGTLQLHKQYIEPYHPMNSLEKLIETDGYQTFATLDPVVRIITKPTMKRVELDRDYVWFEYDFCRTLAELKTKIDEQREPGSPIFGYTQPQNVHRIVLKDKADPVPPGEKYPGFFAPYASQVKYMDACFGGFIDYLKARGQYDNSIIILTSDHGDSLGEGGRWGHSYWMFPEIVRVPLIIHVPATMMKDKVCDTRQIAFTTDITPTLYYLLGHRPIEANPIFGKPLIRSVHDTAVTAVSYAQERYLLVSSYGPVYCVLRGDAGTLFIADAVNQKDYFFNLLDDPKGLRNRLTNSIQSENEALIREMVGSINDFYGVSKQ